MAKARRFPNKNPMAKNCKAKNTNNTATGGFFRCNRWQDEDNHDFYADKPDQMPPPVSATDAANDEVMNNPEVMAQT